MSSPVMQELERIEKGAEESFNGNGRHEFYLKWIFRALTFWIRWQINLWEKSESEKKSAPSTPARKTR